MSQTRLGQGERKQVVCQLELGLVGLGLGLSLGLSAGLCLVCVLLCSAEFNPCSNMLSQIGLCDEALC